MTLRSQEIGTSQAGYHVFRCTSIESAPVARPIEDTLESAEALRVALEDGSEGADVCHRVRYVTLTELEAARPAARTRRLAKPHKCAQCKAAGDEIEADDAVVFVTGSIDDGESRRPYRGYLCESHLTILTDDGLTIRSRRSV